MKAITAVCATGASVPALSGGRVHRHRDGENAEIQMYLSKLQDLVPFMPKNRKISKLEVIQHVIDYICDLQSALETHPAAAAASGFDAAAALATAPAGPAPAPPARQPLGLRAAPNTILPPASNTSTLAAAHHHSTNHHTTPEKSSQPDRSLSC